MRDKDRSPVSTPDQTAMSDQPKSIEHAMRRAVRHALLTHKRAGNTVAAWRDGRVVLVTADDIPVAELARGRQK